MSVVDSECYAGEVSGGSPPQSSYSIPPESQRIRSPVGASFGPVSKGLPFGTKLN